MRLCEQAVALFTDSNLVNIEERLKDCAAKPNPVLLSKFKQFLAKGRELALRCGDQDKEEKLLGSDFTTSTGSGGFKARSSDQQGYFSRALNFDK